MVLNVYANCGIGHFDEIFEFFLVRKQKDDQTYQIIEAECKYIVWGHFKPISNLLRLIIFKIKTIFYDFS